MGDVVWLGDYRPHITGDAICLVCNREWVAVALEGTVELQCPDCDEMSGVFNAGFTEELTDD